MTEPTPPQHETADKPWRVRLICCGRDDGTAHFATRGEAEVMRGAYLTAEGHDRAAIITGPVDQQQQDTADTLAEYLTAMLADNGMRNVVSDCLRLVAALRGERDRQWQLLEIAERAEKAEVERAAFRRGFEEIYTERNQLAATLDRVRAAMDEIEKRAREAEQAGTASAYCALWDAHGLVQDALDPQPQQDAPQRHAGGPSAAETGTQPRHDGSEAQEAAQDATGYRAVRRQQHPEGGQP